MELGAKRFIRVSTFKQKWPAYGLDLEKACQACQILIHMCRSLSGRQQTDTQSWVPLHLLQRTGGLHEPQHALKACRLCGIGCKQVHQSQHFQTEVACLAPGLGKGLRNLSDTHSYALRPLWQSTDRHTIFRATASPTTYWRIA